MNVNVRHAKSIAIPLVVIASTLFVFFALPAFAVDPEGIVPLSCQGGPGENAPACELCDLYYLGNNFVRFLTFTLAIPIGALAVLWGGFLLMTSADSQTRREQGKKALTNAVIGIIIVFTAWLIINTLLLTIGFQVPFQTAVVEWNAFPSCPDRVSPPSYDPPSPPGPPPEGGPIPRRREPPGERPLPENVEEAKREEERIRNQLLGGNGIDGFNKTCNVRARIGTCVFGLNEAAISGAKSIAQGCKGFSPSCSVTITGGTELGHSGRGPGSHYAGDKIDFRASGILIKYITDKAVNNNRFTELDSCTHGAWCYKDTQTNAVLYREASPDHIDICFANCAQ